jgi:hypothetical protein
MQYALLIYSKPGAAEALSADEREANHREYLDIKKLPGVVGGASLHPVETATAARIPAARIGGSVEIRPVVIDRE